MLYSTQKLFYLAASLPVMFSIPTPIACTNFNKNFHIHVASLSVYKYSGGQKSWDQFLSLALFFTCAKETVRCKYNFICSPHPILQLLLSCKLYMYWLGAVAFSKFSCKNIICCITHNFLYYTSVSRTFVFFLAAAAIDSD